MTEKTRLGAVREGRPHGDPKLARHDGSLPFVLVGAGVLALLAAPKLVALAIFVVLFLSLLWIPGLPSVENVLIRSPAFDPEETKIVA